MAALGGVSGLGQVADDQVGQAGLVADDQAVHARQTDRSPDRGRGRSVRHPVAGLVTALCTGLPQCQTRLVVALDVVVLVAVLVADDPKSYEPATRTVKLTPNLPRSARNSARS
ncbi:hypothetical protein GCM10010521_48490 [Streptomyces rameus]|uniref:Uncharacterized protein n=1 Tax=Streptomyces rameus TaxID=68261 RepID=A0ABP6NUP5_9ACTN